MRFSKFWKNIARFFFNSRTAIAGAIIGLLLVFFYISSSRFLLRLYDLFFFLFSFFCIIMTIIFPSRREPRNGNYLSARLSVRLNFRANFSFYISHDFQFGLLAYLADCSRWFFKFLRLLNVRDYGQSEKKLHKKTG